MKQSEFISLVREKAPEFSLGLDDKALWEVLQSRYDYLKDEPYKPPISTNKNLKPSWFGLPLLINKDLIYKKDPSYLYDGSFLLRSIY